MTINIDKKGGSWIDLQQSEMCGKASVITCESICGQVNMNHWTRRCIQCTIRLPFTSITLKNNITMEFYSSLWMMGATHTHTSQFPMLQRQNMGKDCIIDYVKYLVTKTEEQQNLHARNISTDRLYTSVELSKWLLRRNITTVGTVQKGRHGIPHELFDVKGREKFIETCHYKEKERHVHNIICCYYKVKREKECRDSFDNETNGCLYQRWW